MSEWDPAEEGQPEMPPFVMVTTSQAVPITVREVEDERTPDEAVCLGTFYQGRLIARCVVPPDTISVLHDTELFTDPVHLGLLGFEESPGVQCRLLAFVEADLLPEGDEEQDEDGEEPWRASVPSPSFERGYSGQPEGGGMGEPEGTVPVLLGHIVRLARDRKHPDDLARETMDVLATILTGKLSEVVDRVLDDILGDASKQPPDDPAGEEPPEPAGG